MKFCLNTNPMGGIDNAAIKSFIIDIFFQFLRSNSYELYIIIIHSDNGNFYHAQLGLDICPKMKPSHISLNTAHRGCNPSSFMPSLTHSPSLPVSSHASLPSTFQQADTTTKTGYEIHSRFHLPVELNARAIGHKLVPRHLGTH